MRHKVALVYHPQTNRQSEVCNQEVKQNLGKTIHISQKDWEVKLDDDFWAYIIYQA